jgi:hypothetical protein
MKLELTPDEKVSLKKKHRTERDGRIRDRIKRSFYTLKDGHIN